MDEVLNLVPQDTSYLVGVPRLGDALYHLVESVSAALSQPIFLVVHGVSP